MGSTPIQNLTSITNLANSILNETELIKSITESEALAEGSKIFEESNPITNISHGFYEIFAHDFSTRIFDLFFDPNTNTLSQNSSSFFKNFDREKLDFRFLYSYFPSAYVSSRNQKFAEILTRPIDTIIFFRFANELFDSVSTIPLSMASEREALSTIIRYVLLNSSTLINCIDVSSLEQQIRKYMRSLPDFPLPAIKPIIQSALCSALSTRTSRSNIKYNDNQSIIDSMKYISSFYNLSNQLPFAHYSFLNDHSFFLADIHGISMIYEKNNSNNYSHLSEYQKNHFTALRRSVAEYLDSSAAQNIYLYAFIEWDSKIKESNIKYSFLQIKTQYNTLFTFPVPSDGKFEFLFPVQYHLTYTFNLVYIVKNYQGKTTIENAPKDAIASYFSIPLDLTHPQDMKTEFKRRTTFSSKGGKISLKTQPLSFDKLAPFSTESNFINLFSNIKPYLTNSSIYSLLDYLTTELVRYWFKQSEMSLEPPMNLWIPIVSLATRYAIPSTIVYRKIAEKLFVGWCESGSYLEAFTCIFLQASVTSHLINLPLDQNFIDNIRNAAQKSILLHLSKPGQFQKHGFTPLLMLLSFVDPGGKSLDNYILTASQKVIFSVTYYLKPYILPYNEKPFPEVLQLLPLVPEKNIEELQIQQIDEKKESPLPVNNNNDNEPSQKTEESEPDLLDFSTPALIDFSKLDNSNSQNSQINDNSNINANMDSNINSTLVPNQSNSNGYSNSNDFSNLNGYSNSNFKKSDNPKSNLKVGFSAEVLAKTMEALKKRANQMKKFYSTATLPTFLDFREQTEKEFIDLAEKLEKCFLVTVNLEDETHFFTFMFNFQDMYNAYKDQFSPDINPYQDFFPMVCQWIGAIGGKLIEWTTNAVNLDKFEIENSQDRTSTSLFDLMLVFSGAFDFVGSLHWEDSNINEIIDTFLSICCSCLRNYCDTLVDMILAFFPQNVIDQTTDPYPRSTSHIVTPRPQSANISSNLARQLSSSTNSNLCPNNDEELDNPHARSRVLKRTRLGSKIYDRKSQQNITFQPSLSRSICAKQIFVIINNFMNLKKRWNDFLDELKYRMPQNYQMNEAFLNPVPNLYSIATSIPLLFSSYVSTNVTSEVAPKLWIKNSQMKRVFVKKASLFILNPDFENRNGSYFTQLFDNTLKFVKQMIDELIGTIAETFKSKLLSSLLVGLDVGLMNIFLSGDRFDPIKSKRIKAILDFIKDIEENAIDYVLIHDHTAQKETLFRYLPRSVFLVNSFDLKSTSLIAQDPGNQNPDKALLIYLILRGRTKEKEALSWVSNNQTRFQALRFHV